VDGATLFALRWSPPSVRARWVLRARGVPYREVAYIPSSLHSLRLIRATGRASVPVLFAGDEVLGDSTSIARWADARATQGKPLFPVGADAEIDAWTATSDELFRRSRDLFGPELSRDREALRAVVDAPPLWVRALFPLIWRFAGRSFGRRYDVGSEARSDANARLRTALARAEERRAGRSYLVGDALTYADVALASLLIAVRAPPADLVPIPEALSRHWSTVAEPGPWDALFAWRDEIWRKHYPA
jgi:glutathione S-transferase